MNIKEKILKKRETRVINTENGAKKILEEIFDPIFDEWEEEKQDFQDIFVLNISFDKNDNTKFTLSKYPSSEKETFDSPEPTIHQLKIWEKVLELAHEYGLKGNNKTEGRSMYFDFTFTLDLSSAKQPSKKTK